MRSEIIDTGHPQVKAARIIINAPVQEIFDLVAQPARHPEFDGSHTVRAQFTGADRLSLGSTFGMKMHLGIKYRITNTVVEFEENKQIAWRHLGRWIWRYEFLPLSPSQTMVTETFDGRPSPFQWWLRWRKAYGFTQIAVAKTLVRLKTLAEKA